MSRHLHIVCWGAPWPANNSVAIDIFHTIEALHQQDIKIHLHYFCTNPNCHPTELNKYCESVHPYHSNQQKKGNPLISCESSDKMAEILSNDNFPVLFEGIGCTAALKKIAASSKKIVVRMYNDECRYHAHLAESSKNLFFQKFKLARQVKEMKQYEDGLPQNCIYAFSNKENAATFKQDHLMPHIDYLPVFHPYKKVVAETGMGNFCLYHGDLSDPDNEKAVIWLLTKVFNEITTPLVIAGKEPGNQIKKLAEMYSHTCLIIDPSPTEMEDLISKAHINILPSFSNKRPEFKLVHSILNGKHCITNDNGIKDTVLESACHVAKNANAFKSVIVQLYHQPFEEEEIKLRKKIIASVKEEPPVKKLMSFLYE